MPKIFQTQFHEGKLTDGISGVAPVAGSDGFFRTDNKGYIFDASLAVPYKWDVDFGPGTGYLSLVWEGETREPTETTDTNQLSAIVAGSYYVLSFWQLKTQPNDLRIVFTASGVATNYYVSNFFSGYREKNVQVIGVLNTSTGGVNLYRNGEFHSTITLPGFTNYTPTQFWTGGGLFLSRYTFVHGTYAYNHALTQSEISGLYSNWLNRSPLSVQTKDFYYPKPTNLENEVNVIGWENTVTGNTRVASTQAYGTWEYEFIKNGASTFVVMYFIASTTSGGNGYRISISSDEKLKLQIVTGSSSTIMETAASYVSLGVLYGIKIDRNSYTDEFHTGPIGSFKVWIRGGAFGSTYTAVTAGGIGTNPITDNTHTSSTYSILDLDAGDTSQNFSRVRALDFNGGTGTYTRILEDSLVASYNMIPSEGNVLTDISGNGNNGTINGPLATLEGMSFDGVDDYIDCGNDTALDITDTLSIRASFTPKNIGAIETILHKGGGADINNIVDNYRVYISSAGKLVFLYANAIITNIRLFTLNSVTLTENRHDILIRYTPPTLTSIEIVVDGIKYTDSDGAWTDGTGTPTSSNMTMNSNSFDLKIGVREYQGVNIQYFTGEIEDVRINNELIVSDTAYHNDRASQVYLNEDFRYLPCDGTNVLPLGWVPGTGSYKGVENAGLDGSSKAIENTVDGTTSTVSTQAYGTWEFEFNKTIGKAWNIYFIRDDNVLIGGSTNESNSYFFNVSTAENVRMYRRDDPGTQTNLRDTGVGYVQNGVTYGVKITRSTAGVITTYIKGGSFGSDYTLINVSGGSGTNPVTDTTHTTSKFIMLQDSNGVGNQTSNLKFTKGIVV